MRVSVKGVASIVSRVTTVAVIGALLLPMAMAAAQAGGIGGRVANPDPDNPRSRSIFIYTLKQGEEKQDQLLVKNDTDKEQTIRIGSVDGVVTNVGDYTCREELEPVERSGGWVTLSKREVTLAPGEEELVDFVVKVPDNADVGEHNSCLTMQAVDEGEEVASGVRLHTRSAIRMSITIPGDLVRDISITEFTVSHAESRQDYTLTVTNKGNVSADIEMGVTVMSWLGNEVASDKRSHPLVPGNSMTKQFTTELRPMFGGWYTATPVLRYDTRLGAFGTENPDAEYEIHEGEPIEMFFWPTAEGWAVIAAVLAIFATVLGVAIARLRGMRRLKASASTYTVKEGDTIGSLAESSKVTWKELAKLNNLSAPYTLSVGQKILLPNHKKPTAKTSKPSMKD